MRTGLDVFSEESASRNLREPAMMLAPRPAAPLHSEVALTEVIESSEGIEGWGAKTSNDAGSATATCVRPVHVDTTFVVHAGGHGGGRTSRVNSSGSTSSDPDTTVPTTAQQEHACTKALLLRADPADSLGSLFKSFPSQ